MSQRPMLLPREVARSSRILIDLDAALRASIEASTDTWVVYSARRGADGAIVDLVIEYANEAYWAFTGLDRWVSLGRGVVELTPALRWVGPLEAMRRAIATGEAVVQREVHAVRQLGPNKGAAYIGTLVVRPVGDLVAVEFRDVTEIVEAKEAAVLAAARFEAIFESAPIAMLAIDFDPLEVRANHAAVKLLGWTSAEISAEFTIDTGLRPWATPAIQPLFAGAFDSITSGSPVRVGELDLIRRDGILVQVSLEVAPVFDADRRVIGAISSYVDLTVERRLTAERDQLAAAIEQAAESVEITDLAGRIQYVNPAFLRATGYTREEIIGQPTTILKSGVHVGEFYEAMWATLRAGDAWAADFVNKRKDGSLLTEAVVVSPIRNAAGTPTGYVAVKRDITHERELLDRSEQLIRERALIADMIRALRAGDTVEATAQAICRQVLGLRDMTAAQIFIFELDGRASPLGFVVEERPDPELRRLPPQRSRYLRDRAEQGPWIEPWVIRPSHPYNRELSALGDHVVGYAPIRHDGRLVGLLVVDAAPGVDEAHLAEELPALVEFADLTGAIIGRAVAERTEVRRGRARILDIIAKQAFRPVFQPIVDLETGDHLGYEALTRFSDGIAPNIHFEDAAVVGVGLELEIATLEAAIAAAVDLPSEAWLDVNVSPELIMAGDALPAVLRDCPRAIVLEVTEHAAITDYDRFRESVAALGPSTRVAVDDAGAGYSSLRHILELRPAFVKLDRSIVSGLQSDQARLAMVAGLLRFARLTGCRLIPEGIETEEELEALRSLDIHLGQGFLLGRPGPATPD